MNKHFDTRHCNIACLNVHVCISPEYHHLSRTVNVITSRTSSNHHFTGMDGLVSMSGTTSMSRCRVSRHYHPTIIDHLILLVTGRPMSMSMSKRLDRQLQKPPHLSTLSQSQSQSSQLFAETKNISGPKKFFAATKG